MEDKLIKPHAINVVNELRKHNLNTSEIIEVLNEALNIYGVLKPLKDRDAMTFYDWSVHNGLVQVLGGYRSNNETFSTAQALKKYKDYRKNL